MSFCFVGCVVGVISTKTYNEHLCGRPVPRMSRRPLQVKFEIVGCAGEFVAQWVVSVRLDFGDLLRECPISRSA